MVSISQGRIDKYRSRKPIKIKFVKKVIPTENEIDYIKYMININS